MSVQRDVKLKGVCLLKDCNSVINWLKVVVKRHFVEDVAIQLPLLEINSMVLMLVSIIAKDPDVQVQEKV